MAESKALKKDNYLFREGDAPDSLYIVKSGTLLVTKFNGNTEVTIAEINKGALVGEMALFDRKPRSANIKAKMDSEVIALPYDSLEKQMEAMPVWLKAILKNLNENLREANKKLRVVESTNKSEERFPPHIINKFISIYNLVCNRYGKTNESGQLVLHSWTLRNYTIQIFQEATNKMNSVMDALADLEMVKIEDRGDGTQNLVNLFPEDLFKFVDWYNEWLFKPDKDRLAEITENEYKILNGILHFARKSEPNHKGLYKVDLSDAQNDSMRELNFLLKPDDVNSLIEKKYLSEKIMDEKGVYLMVELPYVEVLAKNWKLVTGLKRRLR